MDKEIAVCIGTDRIGHVRVQLNLMVVDSGNVITERYHSVNVAPGEDAEAVRTAVQTHLAQADSIPGAPWPAIPDSEWAKVTAVIAAVQTPDVISAYQAFIQSQQPQQQP